MTAPIPHGYCHACGERHQHPAARFKCMGCDKEVCILSVGDGKHWNRARVLVHVVYRKSNGTLVAGVCGVAMRTDDFADKTGPTPAGNGAPSSDLPGSTAPRVGGAE